MQDETYKGVPLLSRYHYWEEIQQMRRFLSDADEAGLSGWLLSLYYDSNASFCLIETVDSLLATDPEADRLREIASRHIAQFALFGVIGHKGETSE